MTRKINKKEYNTNFNDENREAQEMQSYVDAFRQAVGSSLDAIRRMGSVFHAAVAVFGFDTTMSEFQRRFPEQTKHNWEMLDSIGMDQCDARVFFLPRHLHTMRFLKKAEQENLFNMKNITVIRSKDDKETVVDLGKIKSSEWNILFDKDHKRLRTHFEQKEYAKKIRDEKAMKEKVKPKFELVKGASGTILKLRSDVHSLNMTELEEIFSQISLSNN